MSDTYSVVYSPEAIDDLREIYSYIAFTLMVPETAQKQVNRTVTVIRIFYAGRNAANIVNAENK